MISGLKSPIAFTIYGYIGTDNLHSGYNINFILLHLIIFESSHFSPTFGAKTIYSMLLSLKYLTSLSVVSATPFISGAYVSVNIATFIY